jgi:hypothetical protein
VTASEDYILGMRGADRVPFALVLTLGIVLCRPVSGSDGSDVAKATPVASPAPKRLDLGPYVERYGQTRAQRILDVPHFETRVDVPGKAMDSAALTARMEWWMRDYEPIRGSVPRQGSAPSIEEMREYRPHVTEGVNFAPVLDWLLGTLNKKP